MIGAGNVAWHLSQAMKGAGYIPTGVYSRHKQNAGRLAGLLDCYAYDNLEEMPMSSDIVVISVKDDAIPGIADSLANKIGDGLVIHTAGSVSIDIFKGKAKLYGVMYPLQSFSKTRKLDFRKIPLFIEGNTSDTEDKIRDIANKLSDCRIISLDSAHRKKMHLAAVFASNFANHCCTCAKELLEDSGVDFAALIPLIDETANKIHELDPETAQTGPAVRFDRKVLDMQESMLNGNMLDIYRSMSRNIHETAKAEQKKPLQ